MDKTKAAMTAEEARKAARGVAGIVEKAMEINVRGRAEVFVNIMPHVGSVTVEFYKNGWDGSRNREDWLMEACYGNSEELAEIKKKLEAIK